MHAIKKLLMTNKTGLVNSYCKIPWTNLLINDSGFMFACWCEGKVKKPIGNILDIKNSDEFWNVLNNNFMRESILNKSYKLCHAYKCELLQDAILKEKPSTTFFTDIKENLSKLKLRWLYLQIDESCNLQCPSCRNDIIIHKNNNKTKIVKDILQKVEEYIITPNNDRLTIRLVGNGELFASHTLMAWFFNFDFKKYDNVDFFIHTNATLLSKHEEFLLKIADKLEGFEVSLDAATPETYKIVRKGGNWQDVINGLQTIKKLRNISKKINLTNSFVVSSLNYKDMPEFIKFASANDARLVFYKVLRWQISEQKFKNLNIFSPTHELHEDFNQMLKSINFDNNKIEPNIFNVKI